MFIDILRNPGIFKVKLLLFPASIGNMQAKFSRPLKFKNLLIGKWFCVDSYGFLSMLAIERFWNELSGNIKAAS